MDSDSRFKQEPLPIIRSFTVRPPVVWITGLSGSGKSTLARSVIAAIKPVWQSTVLVDGDSVREICGQDLSYSRADRLANAYRIARLCRFLNEQNVLVVCSTISFFHEIHDWNRSHFNPYIEALLKADLSELKRRNSKGLYGEDAGSKDVVGVDQILEEPRNPDLRLSSETETDLDNNIDTIVKAIYSHAAS